MNKVNGTTLKKKLTISDFKNQVGCMLNAITQLDSKERTEAFGYLQKCINNLDPEEETRPVDEGGHAGREACKKILHDFDELENKKDDSLGSISTEDQNSCEQESSFKCLICGDSFNNSESYYVHSLQHPNSVLSCRQCRKSFCNFEVFWLHKDLKFCVKNDSRTDTNLNCLYCNKNYNNLRHYTLHIEAHKRNRCKICDANLVSRKDLENHMIDQHETPLNRELFTCQLCYKQFAQKRALSKHYKICHIEDNIICLVCCLVFSKQEELDEHVKTHKLVSSFRCEECNVTFSRKQQYSLHIKDHDKYQCVTCKKSYPNKTLIERHEQDGHVIRGLAMQHACSLCDREFHFHSSLFFHIKTHSNEQKRSCSPCRLTFHSHASYKLHIASAAAHFPSDTVPTEILECNYCGKMFTLKRKLVWHRSKCKKGKTSTLQCEFCDYKTVVESVMKMHQSLHTKKKEFICDKCGDFFYSKNSLSDHFKYIHSDERNFSCEKCGQTFKAANVLTRHMLCHIKERNHVCHCGQSYKFKCNLRRHQLMVHGSTTSKRVKRLIDDDSVNYSSSHNKKKKMKQELEKEHTENVSESVYTLISTQAMPLPPLTSEPHGSVLMPPNGHPETQVLQVSYHDMSFSTENKTHLVYSQSLDMENLHVVETMLQSDESLKNGSNALVDSSHQNIFSRQLNDHDGSEYHLHSDGLIHPPIEPSLVTSLGEPLHPADSEHLAAAASGQQNLMSSLPDNYMLPHNFSFLNM